MSLFLRRTSVLKIHLTILKLVLYVSHHLVSSSKFTVDEIMAKAHDQFQESKMDFKTRNSSKKKLQT